MLRFFFIFFFFFFNDTATTEIYTLSLHDALPILIAIPTDFSSRASWVLWCCVSAGLILRSRPPSHGPSRTNLDRKSTRLNSSHLVISYAVFCLKKKNTQYSVDILVSV